MGRPPPPSAGVAGGQSLGSAASEVEPPWPPEGTVLFLGMHRAPVGGPGDSHLLG